MRRSAHSTSRRPSTFQSTHPLRGATAVRRVLNNRLVISIHAPLAGCDSITSLWACTFFSFQSTHPLRGATLHGRAVKPPRAHFNPRTPCGVRRDIFGYQEKQQKFQSTHPLRGATLDVRICPLRARISIHAPLAGCDFYRLFSGVRLHISIHAPLAGCDSLVTYADEGEFISTHAPLAGCDFLNAVDSNKMGYFNPRTPCGVRPPGDDLQVDLFAISTHAPLAGCDGG